MTIIMRAMSEESVDDELPPISSPGENPLAVSDDMIESVEKLGEILNKTMVADVDNRLDLLSAKIDSIDAKITKLLEGLSRDLAWQDLEARIGGQY